MGSLKPGPLPPQRKSTTDGDLPLGGFNPPTPWPSPAPSMSKPAQPRIPGSLGAGLVGGLQQSAVPMTSRSLLEPTSPLTQPPPRAGAPTTGPSLMAPAAGTPATRKPASPAPITWAPLAEKRPPQRAAVDHAAHRNAVMTSTFDNRDKVMARINEAYDDDPRLAGHYRQILAMDSPKEREAYAARNLLPLSAKAAPVEDATEAPPRANPGTEGAIQAPSSGERETLSDTDLPSWREGVERASGYRLSEASARKGTGIDHRSSDAGGLSQGQPQTHNVTQDSLIRDIYYGNGDPDALGRRIDTVFKDQPEKATKARELMAISDPEERKAFMREHWHDLREGPMTDAERSVLGGAVGAGVARGMKGRSGATAVRPDPEFRFTGKRETDAFDKGYAEWYAAKGKRLEAERSADPHRIIAPSESYLWTTMKNDHPGRKTNGLTGSRKLYFEWDRGGAGKHQSEIEVDDHNGKHLGAIEPLKGKRVKGSRKGRGINVTFRDSPGGTYV